MDLPYHPEDFSKYEAGAGKLSSQYLIVALHIHGTVEAEDKQGVFQFLESVDAVLAGDAAWLVKTTMNPKQVVEAIRHHLMSDEYVCVFAVCNELSWAGPRHIRKFFEASGVHIQRSEEIPRAREFGE